MDQKIHEAASALQQAAEWVGEAWEAVKDAVGQAFTWLEQGLVSFWNSPWRDVVLGVVLSAIAIGVVAATGGLAAGLSDLPLFAAAMAEPETADDPLRGRLTDLDVDALTPRDALDLLYELKRLAEP